MLYRCCILVPRTLPVVVLLAVLSPGCNKPQIVEDEQAVQAIEALGGKVVRDESVPARPVMELKFTKVTDADLKEVARLKRLNSLILADTEVTDAGLRELATMKHLAALDLTNTRVTDTGLKELAPLKGMLNRLVLTGTQTTDAGVADLQKTLTYCQIER